MAVLGLSSIKEAALYTAAANQKKMAKEAMKKARTREAQTKKCLTHFGDQKRLQKRHLLGKLVGAEGLEPPTRPL